jgi:hypothetical protein
MASLNRYSVWLFGKVCFARSFGKVFPQGPPARFFCKVILRSAAEGRFDAFIKITELRLLDESI